MQRLFSREKCDREGILKYFDKLTFGDQLQLLADLSKKFQNAKVQGRPKSGDCDEDSVMSFFRTLTIDERLDLVREMVSKLKPLSNNNNMGEALTNEELQAAYNALPNKKSNVNLQAELNALARMGGRRKSRRKASRRRLTRRRR